ncbi:MAG: hypothetical protein P1U56_09175 [Saprospiraceae bacterium]|nr:hypothetical protein [Saprospiraceae bacterium]
MKNIICLFSFCFLFLACKDTTKTANLEAEVIAIHDEVMPKMGDIHLAKKNLRKILTSTENDSVKTQVLSIITDLENADEGMMEWMANWNVPEDNNEKINYLGQEKINITKVKDDMISSLELAANFINKHNNK